MAYKNNTVVISIPVESEDNNKLYKIAEIQKNKSKTNLASKLLKEAINNEYSKYDTDE